MKAQRVTPTPLSELENQKLLADLRETYNSGVRTCPPPSREGCKDIPRPCPYVSCRYNNYLEVERGGRIRLNFPDLEPHEMADVTIGSQKVNSSCVLDIAEAAEEAGGMSYMAIGNVLQMSDEAVRLDVIQALAKLKKRMKRNEAT